MSKATIGSEAFSTDVTDGYDANGNPKIIKKKSPRQDCYAV